MGSIRHLFHLFRNIPFLRRPLNSLYFQKKVLQRGKRVRVGGNFFLSAPSSLVIGEGVKIGKNASFHAEGGVLIGDRTRIGDDVSFETYEHGSMEGVAPQGPRPILIGRDVWIGDRVRIHPGVILKDGVEVSDDVEVKGGDKESEGPKASGPTEIREKGSYTAQEKKEALFFVLSTGRSGSKSIADILSEHSQVHCAHEPFFQIVRASIDHLHGMSSYQGIEQELEYLFTRARVFGEGIQGISHPRIVALLPYLTDLLPEARFIWLIREPRDFISSAHVRGWFKDDELDQRGKAPFVGAGKKWAYYRPHADLMGEMSYAEWRDMPPFERICWYWATWNHRIEKGLTTYVNDRWMMVRLEELQDELPSILSFIGASEKKLPLKVSNPGDRNSSNELWSRPEEEAFQRWCAPLRDRLYTRKAHEP